jgi:hypothetical protein
VTGTYVTAGLLVLWAVLEARRRYLARKAAMQDREKRALARVLK